MLTTVARLGGIKPLLIVANAAESARFYVDALGFEVTFQAPDQEPFFVMVRRDGVELMLKAIGAEVAALPNPARHPWAKWDAFVSAEDPEALATEVTERGVITVRAEATDDGMLGFEVSDRDGYCLFFGRPVA